MGASWIHGIGPGCGDDEEWTNKENPIYTIAKENGIATVKTWDNEDDANSKYYWWKGPEEEPDEEKIEKIQEQITNLIEEKTGDASQGQSFKNALDQFESGD